MVWLAIDLRIDAKRLLWLNRRPVAFIAQDLGESKSSTDLSRHRGSYMSAHVLLNILNELGTRDKMRGLPSILSLFSQRV